MAKYRLVQSIATIVSSHTATKALSCGEGADQSRIAVGIQIKSTMVTAAAGDATTIPMHATDMSTKTSSAVSVTRLNSGPTKSVAVHTQWQPRMSPRTGGKKRHAGLVKKSSVV